MSDVLNTFLCMSESKRVSRRRVSRRNDAEVFFPVKKLGRATVFKASTRHCEGSRAEAAEGLMIFMIFMIRAAARIARLLVEAGFFPRIQIDSS